MDRIFSKNMEITAPGRLSKADLSILITQCSDLVAVYKNDTHLFCTREGGVKFNYRSIKKLGKLLPNINPADIQLVRTPYSDRQPDSFFRAHIDPNQPIDEQVIYSQGRYSDPAKILANMLTDVKKKRNMIAKSSVESKGVLGAYDAGDISAGEVNSNFAVRAIITEAKEKQDMLKKDLGRGKGVKFSCHLTGVTYKIMSFKGDGDVTTDAKAVESEDEDVDMIDLDTMTTNSAVFHKQKHYFFYSKKGGYGKSTFMANFCKRVNASVIRDMSNLTGVSEDAQFLFIDEYGPRRRFGMDDLKGFTCGTAQGFTGNRKSHGASYKPRTDVQLIILSNKHLFDCMGSLDRKAKLRKVSAADADLLKQRFTIYRMDETKKHTQETDAKMHTEDDPEEEEEDEEAADFCAMMK
jgi:hypothetical protein